MKPKHHGGYTGLHTALCEQTLVTLLRGLGPWRRAIYLTGGLVPRYLIPRAEATGLPPHVGTTDVDLVLDLELLAEVEAYRRLEQNLKSLGFARGTNDEGQAQHFSWRKPIDGGITIVVDLLCEVPEVTERVVSLPGERRLSALNIPGAHLIAEDYIEVRLTAALLDDRGLATETVRVANITPFLVLKALAYEDRFEEKDAYDLIYCLMHYGEGPSSVAGAFRLARQRWSDEPLLDRAIDILRRRFASDEGTAGARKDGPTSYARFLTDPGRGDLDARHRQNAAAVVGQFLAILAGPAE